MTKTETFLSAFETVEAGILALSEQYGIRVKAYPEEKLYVLNYDQIDSPKYNGICRECRSLVLDFSGKVVSRSFDRFFNYGEGECEVDFQDAIAFEKADGSLIGVYYVPSLQEWRIRTRGTAFAESTLPYSEKTYQDAILECLGVKSMQEFQDLMSDYKQSITFIFEFVSPENHIVTRYKEPTMILLAVREIDGSYPHNGNGFMLNEPVSDLVLNFANGNIRAPYMFFVGSVEDVDSAVARCKNLEEGFVVLDLTTNARVKIKSPAYVKAHHMRGEGLNPKRIAALVVQNEHEEYIAVFPEDAEKFVPYVEAWEELKDEADKIYDQVKPVQDQRTFAELVKGSRLSSVLFSARKTNNQASLVLTHAKESYKIDLVLDKVKG